jgi:DNA-binding transcriptional regulator GbsR (MarR family)
MLFARGERGVGRSSWKQREAMMAETDDGGGTTSPEMQQFIESVGQYFERYALPRIGGRILGLLLVAPRALSLDEIATALQVSRASVSTNIRLILVIGLGQLVTRPGDRRDYYRFSPQAWEQALDADIEGTVALRRIADRGLAAAQRTESAAHQHLAELIDFCDFVLEDRRTLLERWRKRKERMMYEQT